MGLPVPPKPVTPLQRAEAIALKWHVDAHELEQLFSRIVEHDDVSFIFVTLMHHQAAVGRLVQLLRKKYPHLPPLITITEED